ncbi:MAG: PIN domain-containing protein [Candidatus Omnitrophica bacterium]|nr:PIN domain-containing protein [Candidatus Omnitrophota bacterium]
MVLFDTNLLVHAHVISSPYHAIARRLRDEASVGRLEACLSPQVLCEFVTVCTNPRVIQPALTLAEARGEVSAYWTSSGFKKVLPKETTIMRMLHLMTKITTSRVDVFDIFLAATMLDNDVRTIYTQNVKDFVVFKELEVINPFLSQG